MVEFDVAGLQEKIAAAEPGYLAFNGKNAARGALERDVPYGLQDEQIGGAAGLGPALDLGPRPPVLEDRAVAGAGPGLRRRPRPALGPPGEPRRRHLGELLRYIALVYR